MRNATGITADSRNQTPGCTANSEVARRRSGRPLPDRATVREESPHGSSRDQARTPGVRCSLCQAADLTKKSVDTLRKRAGKRAGVAPLDGDTTGTLDISASALTAAGLLSAEQLADGESEAVIARRRAERERDADHDELLTLRAEKAALHGDKPAATRAAPLFVPSIPTQ